MPATVPQVSPDIGPILALVRRTRWLLRSSWGAVGVGLTLGLAFACLVAAAAADMLVPLVGPWLRLAGLVAFLVPTLVVFAWKGLLPLGRRLRNVEVARRIEGRIPGMHSRLVSCMDLAGREGQVSPAFHRKLVSESLDRIGTYRARSAIDWREVRKSVLFAMVGVGLFAILWLALGVRLTTALARVFDPFADIPPASDVAYTFEPGTTRVLRGDDVTFAANVTRGEPDSLSLELEGDGATVHFPLEKGPDNVWRRTLRGLGSERGFEHGFTYRVHGGRTWTRLNRIDWAERPVVLDTVVRLHFPEYMGFPEPRVNPPRESDVIGPEGSRVEVVVLAEGDVTAGEIQLLESRLVRPSDPGHEGLALFAPTAVVALAQWETVAAGAYALHPRDDRTWTGSFPLREQGQYRIELRNDLGHVNKPANGLPRYRAVEDRPPVVQIDQPAADLVLSKPDRVPLRVDARDDYGLLDLWLAVRRDGDTQFKRAVKIKEYVPPNPLAADSVAMHLDLSESGLNLKAGDSLAYRVEARDRRPNAVAVSSKEFTVRIAADSSAADKQLDAFEKNQDILRDKLAQLVAKQRNLKEKIDQVQAKYDALNTKVQSAGETAKLDAKDVQDLEGLRKEMAELSALEQKNVASAAQLDQQLKDLAAQARKTPLLNAAISKETQDLSGRFKNAALDPLAELASQLQQGANAGQTPPDLKDTKAKSDRVQKNLESLKARMDALADAQKGLKSDADQALAKLKDELLKEQGRMSARDLEELREFLKNLRQGLAKHQGKQEDLFDKTEKAPDPAIPEIEGKQATLDGLLKKDLDLAKKILDQEKARRLKRPDFADDPVRKEDTPDRDEDPFKPALGGEREKPDPRFEKKPPASPRKKGDDTDAADRRDALRDHQQDNLRDLDSAQKSLASDERTLEQMIKSLMEAAQKAGPPGPRKDGNTSAKSAEELMKMLRSEALKSATQMANRAKQGRPGPGKEPGKEPPTGPAAESIIGNSVGATGTLDELDPRTRAAILRLPPRVREELLQGMKAQGPEGYQKFIEDYFRRLSEVPK